MIESESLAPRPLATLATGTLALVVLLRVDVGAPPLPRIAAWGSWLDEAGTTAGLLHLAVTAATLGAAYTSLLALLHLVANGTRSRTLSSIARTVTVPALRGVFVTSFGLGTVASLGFVAPVAAEPVADVDEQDVDVDVDREGDEPGTAVTVVVIRPEPQSTPTPAPPREPDPGPPDTAAGPPRENPPQNTGPTDPVPTAPKDHGEVPPTTPNSPGKPAADATRTWRIGPGDHLWRVAEADAARAGAGSDEAGVRAHWLAIIDLNRDRLPDPANPDLVYVGMEVLLPDHA